MPSIAAPAVVTNEATPAIRRLRAQAIGHSLFEPMALPAALMRMGFVQADPIRAPARAQDLMLRHRVPGYRAGDLEQLYPSLDLDEDMLHAYGFLPRATSRLLHPRKSRRLAAIDGKVLDIVRDAGRMHPRELDAHFGRKRVINGWGGYSQATKRALERLHFAGLLRIAGRDNGIRLYEASPETGSEESPRRRLARLVRMLATLLAPVPERTLSANAARIGRWMARPGEHRRALEMLLEAGELRRETIEGVRYVLPTEALPANEVARGVRFLAPFDPVVWDRLRFEHLWQWAYRFEAYTPQAKRVRGYYAMPLLWGDEVIGWANAAFAGKRLDVDVGFVGKRPRDRAFRRELDLEIGRLEAFLAREQAESGRGLPEPARAASG